MALSTLLFCTVVLYAPHCLLFVVALLWQPILVVLSLFSCFFAFVPQVLTGVLFRFLQLCRVTASTTTASWLLVVLFLFQNATRAAVLLHCLRLQRLGLARGWLLVRSRVPLVSLSIAIGAGFALTSLFMSGGALLAQAWTAQLTIPTDAAQMNATATTLAELFAPSASCAQLPQLVLLVFQQTFFTCGQVAWTVMLGQVCAAFAPDVEESTLESEGGMDGAEAGPGGLSHNSEHEATRNSSSSGNAIRVEAAQSVVAYLTSLEESCPRLVDTADNTNSEGEVAAEAPLLPRGHLAIPRMPSTERRQRLTAIDASRPLQQSHGGEKYQREEVEARALVSDSLPSGIATTFTANRATDAYEMETQSSHATAAPKEPSALPPSPYSPVVSGLVVESVLAQRQHAAILTSVAALGLHLLFVLLPLSAFSQSSVSGDDDASHRGCSVYVFTQCLVTLASVVWALWIVQCERHPSAYIRVP